MWDLSIVNMTANHHRILVDFFHSLPHLNMWFAESNSTFDPNNSDYLETVLFWSTVPILFLILLLLVLILYACCLVCNSASVSTIKIKDTSSKKNRSYLRRLKLVIATFALMLSLSLGFLVYGSEHFHFSFHNVTLSIKGFSSYFNDIGNQTSQAKALIVAQINTTNELSRHVRECSANIKECVAEKSARSQQHVAKLAHESLKELHTIRATLNDSLNSLDTLNQVDYEKNAYLALVQQIEVAEHTRWAIMIGVVSINILLILFLAIGLLKNSKGSLCFFAFAGVLSIISIWILNALYLGVTVFIADYCSSPDQYILTMAERNHIKNMVHYYTTCYSLSTKSNPANRYVPFKLDLNRAESKLRTAATLYNDNFVQMSQSFLAESTLRKYDFQESIANVEIILDHIRSMIRCNQTSLNYRQAVQSLCNNSIFGLSVIVISSIVFGLILPVLICIIPQMWRRLHTKDYFEFQRGTSASTGSAASSSNSGGGGGSGIDESHPFLGEHSASANGGGAGHLRANISATRQFKESPSFHRLNLAATGSSANNHNSNTLSHTLGRASRTLSHRNATAAATATATPSALVNVPPTTSSIYSSGMHALNNNNNNNHNNNSSVNHHHNIIAPSNYASTLSYQSHHQAKMNRVNEYVLNTEPYMMLPSAPPPQQLQQQQQQQQPINAYQSYYTQISTMGRERYQ